MLLDDVFVREFEDLEVVAELEQQLPLMLFVHAHAQFRVFLEIGFAGAFCEAYNIARMAIESVYQACKILAEPELNQVWSKKETSTKAAAAYRTAFDFKKRKGYSDLKLGKLHQLWERFSTRSHPSITSLNRRFVISPGEVRYMETDPQTKSLDLNQLLIASHLIENSLFDSFKTRLELDYELEKERAAFQKRADQCRIELIKKFNLKPPKVGPRLP